MSQIIKPHNLDVSKISYSDLKSMGNSGGKIIHLNYKEDVNSGGIGEPIVIHTPKMRLPYGVGIYTDPAGKNKYTLDLSYGDFENDTKMKQFYDAITSIEEKLINDAKTNSLTWFRKKTMSDDVVRTIFSSSIKRSKDKETGEVNNKYPPTLKVKINYMNDEFKCLVWDHNRKKIEGDFTSNLTKGLSVTSIIKCNGIWLSGGKFGLSWQIEQLKLDKPQSLIGYSFRDDSDDESD